MYKKKEIALKTALILMAVYFSMLEFLIPKPFPWMKLGFANISTVIGINSFGLKIGLEITILRIIIYGIMTGTIMSPGFIISITAGILSVTVMGLLFKIKLFSIPMISCFGGFTHNIIQLVVVYFMLFRNIEILQRGTLFFILIFLLIGSISGILVGIVSYKYKNIVEVWRCRENILGQMEWEGKLTRT